MKSVAFLIALVIVAALAVWFGRSNSGPGPAPVDPASNVQPSHSPSESARLEAEAAARKSESAPPAKAAERESAASNAELVAPPQLIDPSVVASGLDGGIPSDASSSADTSIFETKYANATKAELKASYDAMKTLYDENAQGRVQDKEKLLTPEGLAELAREVAWLKDKAFGGG